VSSSLFSVLIITMNKIFLLLVVIAVLGALWYQGSRKTAAPPQPGTVQPGSEPAATSTAVSDCDQALWQHVYHPARLKVLDPCKTVSGTIESVKAEADGDYHIRLKPDPEFNSLLNDKNLSGQNGDLVLEPVCEKAVTQSDAVSACQNFSGHITIPSPGTHVTATGSYVLDTEHGWNEIHPVSKLSIQP
jgi:hypothetical protein